MRKPLLTPSPTTRLLFGFLVCLSLPARSDAQGIGFRQLTSTFPVAVQRGTEATVQVRSTFTLDGAHTALFRKPGAESGIRMTYAETEPIAAPRVEEKSVGTPFRFRVEVPADQEPGVYEYRLATKQAVSSVSHLLITDYPVILEQENENGTPALAQTVAVPAAICGVCADFEDLDCYRFTGAAGQELTLQVYAQRVTEGIHDMAARIGIHLMDSMLTLIGPDGSVVASNNDYVGGDSLITCTLPESGEYVVEVRDYRYAGDPRYTYCVEISDGPFVLEVFPAAVQQGTTAQAQVIGHGLGGLERTDLDSLKDAPVGWKNQRFDSPRGVTNPAPVLVTAYPNITAPSGSRAADAVTPISFPVGVNGRLERQGEIHSFEFTAHNDDYFRFEMITPGRGLPLDGVIEIHDAEGKKLAEADDGPHTKNPTLHFKAPADGKYVVAVRDLHQRGGERFTYHLRAERSGPDFEIDGEYYYAMLAPGTQTIWFARIKRLNGFDGPVEMRVEDLPDGVTCTPVTVAPGVDQCGLIFSAANDAKIGATLARVRGEAKLAGPDGATRTVVRYGRVTCEQRRAGASLLHRWPIDTQIVGVTDPLDVLEVDATPREITLKPGEKAEIKVRIRRNENYTDLVMLDMAFTFGSRTFGVQLPPGITMSTDSKTRLAGEMLEGVIVLEASADAKAIERLPIAVLARAPVTYSIMTNYASKPVHLTIRREEQESTNK